MLGAWLKGIVEEQGSRLTGTPVRLLEASVSPLSGNVALRGLVVANPQGFQADRVLSAGLVTARLDLWSLRSEVLRVAEVDVDSVDVVLETGAGGSNLMRLKRSVAEAREAASRRDGEQKLRIDRLLVRGGRLDLRAFGRKNILPLPPVELLGLGASGGGATFSEVGSAFFFALAEEAMKTAARLLKRLAGG